MKFHHHNFGGTDDKLWLSDNASGLQILTLTETRLQETLLMMRASYYLDEPPAKAVQLQECPKAVDELEHLTVETYLDGASVIAVHQGRVVGASFNKVQSSTSDSGEQGYFENFRDHKCSTEVAKEYIDCMIRMDSKLDVFSHYNVSKSLEVMFLGVSRDFRGRGAGKMLVRASFEVAKSMRLPLVSAIFTSQASQRIGSSLGWDALVRVPMNEHVFRGVPYSERTGDDQSQLLMACRVSL